MPLPSNRVRRYWLMVCGALLVHWGAVSTLAQPSAGSGLNKPAPPPTNITVVERNYYFDLVLYVLIGFGAAAAVARSSRRT